MSKLKKKRPNRRPSHPGEILKNLWLDELGYTQVSFAKMLSKATGSTVQESTMRTKLSEIIKGKRAMSADFAVLISSVLNTTPKMWMNLQINLDIWKAEEKLVG